VVAFDAPWPLLQGPTRVNGIGMSEQNDRADIVAWTGKSSNAQMLTVPLTRHTLDRINRSEVARRRREKRDDSFASLLVTGRRLRLNQGSCKR
jgi:hypothetical protein